MNTESVTNTMEVDGGLPDEWNPYEEGYVPGDLHFVGDDPDIAIEDEEQIS